MMAWRNCTRASGVPRLPLPFPPHLAPWKRSFDCDGPMVASMCNCGRHKWTASDERRFSGIVFFAKWAVHFLPKNPGALQMCLSPFSGPISKLCPIQSYLAAPVSRSNSNASKVFNNINREGAYGPDRAVRGRG